MPRDFGPIDGTWEGAVSYLKGKGLRNPKWPPDFWRFVIQANSVHVFFRRGGSNFTPSATARRAPARSGVRAQSTRKGERVDRSRPCVANEELKELKRKYKIERYMTNVIIFSIHSGKDDDSVWVETEAFLLTQKAQNVMRGVLAGTVNNVGLPINQDISKFLYAGTGEFHRV